jgi:co-chaperonin GroES (HSP10)
MRQQTMGKALKNDEWIEDEGVPTPKVLPNLKGYTILVRPVSIKTETKGGIILPDSLKDDMAYLTTVGKVLAISPDAYKDEKKFPTGPWCKIGEYVGYGKHAGIKIRYKGVKMIMLYDDQVMMTIDDPAELDPSYNLSSG